MGKEVCEVGCKLPHGMTWRLFNMVDVERPLLGGGFKTFKEGVHNVEAGEITISGIAHFKGSTPPMILNGAAITSNVPRDYADEWFRQNASHMAVKNRMVFIIEHASDARAATREMERERSNQEPMHPISDPRTPRLPGIQGRRPAMTVEQGNKAEE